VVGRRQKRHVRFWSVAAISVPPRQSPQVNVLLRESALAAKSRNGDLWILSAR